MVSSIPGTRAGLDLLGTTRMCCPGRESNSAVALVGLRKMKYYMIAEKQRGSEVARC